MNKTIQQVGEMVGIPSKETDKILVVIKANTALLDSCSRPHDFSVCLDRYTAQPIKDPTPAQRFGAKWGCSKCGGYVNGIDKSWYNRGLADQATTILAVLAQCEKALEKSKAYCIAEPNEGEGSVTFLAEEVAPAVDEALAAIRKVKEGK